MSLKLYNVLTGKRENFIPQEEGIVKMYACGITVSDNAHIGHAYQAVIFDVIRRYLEFKGYKVTYVRNYTDVDDKIIDNARKKNENPLEYAERFIEKTNRELDALAIQRPTIQARATDNIQDMINFISKLIEKGHAYVVDNGCVYFDVSSFKNYGSFGHRNLDDLLTGVRKDIEPGKLDDRDFALWKNAGDDEIYWESPWGKGRPGWHIECSTMSTKYLGETLDIHGGGKDLRFPHHENEIAQSESLTGKRFSNYWLHNGLVKVNGQKMSKSLGNGILLQDLLIEYDSDVIKLALLQNNYKSDLNITEGMFENCEKKIYLLYKVFDHIDRVGKDYVANKDSKYYKEIKEKFIEAMDNDFNTSLAISDAFNYISQLSQMIDKKNHVQDMVDIKAALVDIYNVLELFQEDPKIVLKKIREKYLNLNGITEEKILDLIEQRKQMKESKDYSSADRIREMLTNNGVLIKDTREGTEWDIEISHRKIGEVN